MKDLPANIKYVNNPLMDIDTEDLDWLELGSIPERVYNPLLDKPIDFFQEDPVEEVVKLFMNSDYLSFTARIILNVELPPYQAAIIDTLWHKKSPMLIGSRGAAKSYILAVYCLLRMVLNPGCKIVIVGAGLRQSRQVFDYMATIWNNADILQDISGKGKTAGPRREVDRFQFEIGDSRCWAIPIGDGCCKPLSLLTLRSGFSYIKDVVPVKDKVDKEIINHDLEIWGNGKVRKSDEGYYNGVDKTKKIVTERGYDFEATFNHKLRVVEKGEIVWKRMDEMKVSDKILIDRSDRWHCGNINESIDECYALGLMIGDGCWTQQRRLGFATQDKELQVALNNSGSFTGRFNQASDEVHYWIEGKEHRSDWMNKWNLETTYAINKTLPQTILSAEREKMTACLQGLFDTDGSVQVAHDKRGGCSTSVTFWNTSEELVDQIHFILLHYGIIATKRSRQRKNKNWNREFSLQISGQDCVKFAQEIGFRLVRKQKLLLEGISYKTRTVSVKDGVPFVSQEMARIANKFGQKFKIVNNTEYPTFSRHLTEARILKKKEVTREYIDAFLERYEECGDPFIEKLKELSDSNIYYDTITSIEDGECETYDIHVPDGHEYCANGFFSHNTKIRGLRANYIIADEFASIPEEIFNLVVRGFAVVSSTPIQKLKEAARVKKLKNMGIWSDELDELKKQSTEGNQVIYSGTAYYAFNHFYKYFKTWHDIIESKGDPSLTKDLFGEDKLSAKGFNWKDYAIIRIPYTHVPEGMLDDSVLAQSKANLTVNQFLMEFGATFAADSDGFYKRSVIESATTNKPIMIGGKQVQFSASRFGDKSLSYVIGVDPAADQDNAAVVVIELHDDHRRIVHCWTTNKNNYNKLKKNLSAKGIELEDDYYAYIARKLRELMRVYRTEHIIMDKHGGGTAIAEALSSKKNCEPGEDPIYQVIDPEDPKPDDIKEGIHILQLLAPTQEINSDANHGMLKDLQEKTLIFPIFDVIEVAKSVELDHLNNIEFDTYEDVVQEIEELKVEMTSIVVTPSSVSGKETFDTPSIKGEGSRKGHLRKDRYSALLYANYYCRNRNKEESIVIKYKPSGGTKDTIKTSKGTNYMNKPMYTGPGLLKFAQNQKIVNSPRSVGFVKRNKN